MAAATHELTFNGGLLERGFWIKSERQWKELLRKSGIGDDTDIIVLHGEKPQNSKTQALKIPGA